MKTFNDIYNSLNSTLTPKPRSIKDLGIILCRLYETLKSSKFEHLNPFNNSESVFEVNRTTIELLMSLADKIEVSGDGLFIIENEAVERIISDIKTIELANINPILDKDSINKNFNFSYLKASTLFLVDTIRQGISFTFQQKIIDTIKERNVNEKLDYLDSYLLSMNQRKEFWDEFIFKKMSEFIELEIQKWENKLKRNQKIGISSAEELHRLILKLINEKLIHEIRYHEGYKAFWSDEKFSETPRKETNVHYYLKSILKPHCEEYGIKISREDVVANGQVDMTFSYLNYCVCVEVKKAQHQDVLTSLDSQLTEYMIGEKTDYGIYVVLWFKNETGYELPKKFDDLDKLLSEIEVTDDSKKYGIVGIDCTKPKRSPSQK